MNSLLIAVVSDTHVPDRTSAIKPALMASLRELKPDLIIHAGDISKSGVLVEFEQIAPVFVVRGNRDFLLRKTLPKTIMLEKMGKKIVIMHGHIDFFTYWADKFLYVFQGYKRERYIARLQKAHPGGDIYIYGHTHHAEIVYQKNVLFFNPGSVTVGDYPAFQKSWGILRIFEDGNVEGRIIPID